MEITLTQKQLEILGKISAEKEQLKQRFAELSEREAEAVVMIIETAGVKVGENARVTVKDGKLVVEEAPSPEMKIEEAEVVQ
jgi:hypothetical protein